MPILPQFAVFIQVLIIDLSLAADNAVVIGMAAAGLPQEQRRKAILIGLGGATVLRIVFAFFAVQLLHVTGLTLAGGLLLLWVAWKMFGEIRAAKTSSKHSAKKSPAKKLSAAIWQILIADLGMSLDNVLAVAGAARDHYVVLALGLILSIALTGLAATATAKMVQRWPWINWIGIAAVVFVAVRMIWDGGKVFMH